MGHRKMYPIAGLSIADCSPCAAARARERAARPLQVKYGDEVMNILHAQKLPSSIV